MDFVRSARFLWTGATRPDGFVARMEILSNEQVLVVEADAVSDADKIAPLNSSVPRIVVNLGTDDITFSGTYSLPKPPVPLSLAQFNVSGLKANTTYYIATQTPSNVITWVGQSTTFPPEGQSAGALTFAIASCAQWASEAAVTYDIIRQQQPAFFINHGDLFYGDITSDSTQAFVDQYMQTFAQDYTRRFFATVPTMYIYDEHDYGGPNSDSTSPSRQAALSAYDMVVPHYPLRTVRGDPVGFQAFTVGRVRFIITDLRSQALKSGDRSTWTLLGSQQMSWLFAEFANYTSYQMVVWISSRAWNGDANDTNSDWSGYALERRTVANYIAQVGMRNLIVVAGGAHMLAIDDGYNTDFASFGGAGFPLLQSAPLAQTGSTGTTGKFDVGCFAYRVYPSYQYALVTVADNTTGDGSTCFTFAGYSIESLAPMLSYTGCANGTSGGGVVVNATSAPAPAMVSAYCSLPYFPSWIWVVLITGTAVFAGVLASFVRMVVQEHRLSRHNKDGSRRASLLGAAPLDPDEKLQELQFHVKQASEVTSIPAAAALNGGGSSTVPILGAAGGGSGGPLAPGGDAKPPTAGNSAVNVAGIRSTILATSAMSPTTNTALSSTAAGPDTASVDK
ncbi:hypothetical protein RI367_001868 [Sorochytrium milnesiophthora]